MIFDLTEAENNNLKLFIGADKDYVFNYITSLLQDRFNMGIKQEGIRAERKKIAEELLTIPRNYSCPHCNATHNYIYNLTKS